MNKISVVGFFFTVLLSVTLCAAEKIERSSRSSSARAHQGNFAALERITLENIIFNSSARKKIDFSYLTIAMNCISAVDGLEYEASFLLADDQVRPFPVRVTRTNKIVANSNFSGMSAVGPRLGQIDISMKYKNREWVTNIQVTAVATDSESGSVLDNCIGETTFRATKRPPNDFGPIPDDMLVP